MKFRNLNANEIECRVQSNGDDWAILLLYKNARTDANILDEMGLVWENDFKVVNDNLFGGIGIYDNDLKTMIWKWDCGVESNTEKEKGEASDAFKRAGFKWGIGRELYTSPFIYIKLAEDEFKKNNNGKKTVKTNFEVSHIMTVDRVITELTIVDEKGNVRFKYPKNSSNKTTESTKAKEQPKQQEQPKSMTINDKNASDLVASTFAEFINCDYKEKLKAELKARGIDTKQFCINKKLTSKSSNDDFKQAYIELIGAQA